MALYEPDTTPFGIFGNVSFLFSLVGITWNWIADKLTLEKINTGLVTISSLIALVYIIYKVRGQIIDNKIKKIQLKNLQDKEEND